MRTNIEQLREDRVTFQFDAGEYPEFELPNYGKPYRAAVTSIYVRIDAETGEVLSIHPRGKKVKKNGELSVVSAYFASFDPHQEIVALTTRLLNEAGF